MWLRTLQADRLRNLRTVDLVFDPGLTLVTGRNGQGKTSLLEAVYLLGTAHSFRTRRSEEIVHRDGGPLRISGEIAARAGSTRVGVVLDQGRRSLSVDGLERDLDGFLGRLDLVAFTADEMRVLRDAPEGRRRFIDRGVAGLHPPYLRDLSEYRRTLAERNALLRRSHVGGPTPTVVEMEAWEERLAGAAARVHRQRREYVVKLAARSGPTERALFPDGEEIAVRYRPSPASAAETEVAGYDTLLRATLAKGRRRDLALGFTSAGPHRDDLEMTLDRADLRTYGSAGQLRAAMVALSAGKLDLLREERRESPLFLMDDFDSDLDEVRVRSLIDFLREGGFQAMLATSKDGYLGRFGSEIPGVRMDGGTARST